MPRCHTGRDISRKNVGKRTETSLHTVLKFEVNHACFDKTEVGTNCGLSNNTMSAFPNADTNTEHHKDLFAVRKSFLR